MLHSNLINKAVLGALISSGGDPSCVIHTTRVQAQVQQAPVAAPVNQAAPSKKPLPFFAPGRLDMVAPSHNIKLAEENEVMLRVHAPGLTTVTIQQVQYDPDDTVTKTRPHFLHGGWASVSALHKPDGSDSIKVTPRALGPVVLQVIARFADGGFTKSEVVLNVQPSTEIPEKLVVGEWGTPMDQARWVSAFLDPKAPTSGLTVSALYKNVTEEVKIGPSFASFEVRTANNSSPAISIDNTTGLIKPLRGGDALVETSFGGWTNLTCVVVEDHYDLSHLSHQNCRSLLRPGEQVGMSIRK